VVNLALRAPRYLEQPQFDDFLYAAVGEQANGMPMSVISALAWLGIDPWVEAARLAGMPRSSAAAALAPMIGRLPGRQRSRADAQTIADRLVKLLPGPEAATVAVAAPAASARGRILPLIGASLVVAVLIGIAIGSGMSGGLFAPAVAPVSDTERPVR